MTVDNEQKTECKMEVFEALLMEHLGASIEYDAHKLIVEWRERYDSADRYLVANPQLCGKIRTKPPLMLYLH